jgi:hypothetical protein
LSVTPPPLQGRPPVWQIFPRKFWWENFSFFVVPIWNNKTAGENDRSFWHPVSFGCFCPDEMGMLFSFGITSNSCDEAQFPVGILALQTDEGKADKGLKTATGRLLRGQTVDCTAQAIKRARIGYGEAAMAILEALASASFRVG